MKSSNWFSEATFLFLGLLILFLCLFIWEVFSDCSHDSKTPLSELPPIYHHDSSSDNDYNDQNVGELEAFVHET